MTVTLTVLRLLGAAGLCLAAVAAIGDEGAEPRGIRLWPEGPPGAQARPTTQTFVERGAPGEPRDRYAVGITEPSLTIFEADEPSGVGLLIVPGGGYQRVVMDKEGYESARWFAARGITSFVLLHRLPGESWSDGPEVPLQDAQRAMRWIRATAPTFGLDVECIGAMGFSAGGHVVAMLATRYDADVYAPVDRIDRQPARPDFMVLMYPVISMDADIAHPGSRTRLLGEHPSAADVVRYSADRNVTTRTPPTFLLHAADDDSVPLENTLRMHRALRGAGVESELHVFAEGGHGFGLRKITGLPVATWPQRVAGWVGDTCGGAAATDVTVNTRSELQWPRGVEGQRKADRSDGTFLNPIMAGDHPDPTILKDGDDYYMTFSSFDSYPGLVIWHSRDLVNWEPVTAALETPVGSVWAPDLTRHESRYYIYIPARTEDYRSIYVIHADDIRGPWSEPVDLELPRHIDPGHAVGKDGRRYLLLSQGDLVPLSDDGLQTAGPVRHVYDHWQYPEDWTVECACPEGPKVVRRGDWFYLLTAVGGTAGPPTGHMVIAARSRSLQGPWEDAPNNPIVRTRSATEKWWSRGHATLLEGPNGGWWLVYHGYENGYRTLGRQTLLEPVRWTADGWFEAAGGDLSKPLRLPLTDAAVPHGLALSDDFSRNRFGLQWAFYRPARDEMQRVRYEGGALILTAKGTSPADSSPLAFIAGDHAYRVEVEIEIGAEAQGGLLLFYNDRLYAGLGVNDREFVMHRYGLERTAEKPAGIGKHVFMRIENDHHIVTIHTSPDGKEWRKFPVQMETSGYHHNVAYDFLSLRPAIYAAGKGEVRFRNLRYRAF